MGGIQRVKYKTDGNNIFNVLLDESTGIDLVIGAAVADAYTENMTIRVSKNNREVGIKPRMVLLTREIGALTPDANCLVQTGERYKRVPIPTKERWDAIALNSTFTIAGTEYRVKKKLDEKVE